MPTHLRPLTAEEQTKLQRIAGSRSEEARLVERATIVLIAAEGAPAAAIAERLGISENTVRLWVSRFNEHGLAGLQDRARRGRPGVYSEAQLEEVLAVATTPPEALGLPFAQWTLDRLEGYLNDERHIPIRRSRIGELLLRRGLRLRGGVWRRGTEPLG